MILGLALVNITGHEKLSCFCTIDDSCDRHKMVQDPGWVTGVFAIRSIGIFNLSLVLESKMMERILLVFVISETYCLLCSAVCEPNYFGF